MKSGSEIEELRKFKHEAKNILEDAKFPVHKCESNVEELDKEANPAKLFGQIWDKREDTNEIQVPPTSEQTSVTKRHIFKELSSVNYL